MQKNQAKSQTHRYRYRYRYSLSNPVTGLNLTREFHATDDKAAKKRAKYLARCFGRSTVVDKLVRLKEED